MEEIFNKVYGHTVLKLRRSSIRCICILFQFIGGSLKRCFCIVFLYGGDRQYDVCALCSYIEKSSIRYTDILS